MPPMSELSWRYGEEKRILKARGGVGSIRQETIITCSLRFSLSIYSQAFGLVKIFIALLDKC